MKLIKFIAIAIFAAMTANASAQLTKDTQGWTRLELSFEAQKLKYKDGSTSWDDDKQKGVSLAFMKGVNITSKMPIFLDLGASLLAPQQRRVPAWRQQDHLYERRCAGQRRL